MSVFATPSVAALLCTLSLFPEQTFIQKELVLLTGTRLYLVQRGLKHLEAAGLIRRRRQGRQVQYRANSDYPPMAHLREALLRSIALRDPLTEVLSREVGVVLAFVSGDLLERKIRAGGALDVIVSGDDSVEYERVEALVGPAVERLGCQLRLTLLESDESKSYIAPDLAVLRLVSSGKLWLVGTERMLRELSSTTRLSAVTHPARA